MESEQLQQSSSPNRLPVRPSGCEGSRKGPSGEEARLKRACQDFESLFVSYLLKTMRSTSSEGGMFGEGMGGEFYQGLFEAEVARKVAHSGGIGLAEILYRSFSKTGRSGTVCQGMGGRDGGVTPGLTDKAVFERIHQFHHLIDKASQEFGVSMNLIYAVIGQESAGNPFAVSEKGAKGLMQLMDGTVRQLGVVNVFDPRENILAGVRYLRELLDRFDGDLKLGLAAYNAGPNTVRTYGGVPPFKETIQFVRRTLGLSETFGSMLASSAKKSG